MHLGLYMVYLDEEEVELWSSIQMHEWWCLHSRMQTSIRFQDELNAK